MVCLVRDWVPQSELIRSGTLSSVKKSFAETCGDREVVERTLGEYEVDTVFHLAAQTIVGIANRNPGFNLRKQHSRHLESVGSLPAFARSQGHRVGVFRQSLWRSWRRCRYARTCPTAAAAIPTTSARAAPT